LTRFLADIGLGALAFLRALGRILLVGSASVGTSLRHPSSFHLIAQQALLLTRRCFFPVLLVTLPVGIMLTLQALTLVRTFDVERHLSAVVLTMIVREIGPGFAAMMVAMQAGGGIAAELGAMRVSQELDAITIMGLDSRRLLLGPRILGAAIATPVLNALAVVAATVGAFLLAVPVMGVPHFHFMANLLNGLTVQDLWISELKCLVFGLLLGAISAVFGADAQGGSAGVGRAANRAVVASVIMIVATNYALNTAAYGLRGGTVAL
jgi:phospholipid/cholesterol/gamma-HCH transport system permease protein